MNPPTPKTTVHHGGLLRRLADRAPEPAPPDQRPVWLRNLRARDLTGNVRSGLAS